MIETNYLSVVMLTGQVVKGMIARNRGHIVNVSSIAGREAYHGELHRIQFTPAAANPLQTVGCVL